MREQSRSGGCYQDSGRRQKVAAGATESSDKGGGKTPYDTGTAPQYDSMDIVDRRG